MRLKFTYHPYMLISYYHGDSDKQSEKDGYQQSLILYQVCLITKQIPVRVSKLWNFFEVQVNWVQVF